MTRNQAALRLRKLAGLRRDQSAFEHGLVRGRCAARKCQNRYAIVRVTVDFRNPREKLWAAELVCVSCDRVWAATKVPDLAAYKNVQRHRLLLVLPPEKTVHIWISRGRVQRQGDDALIVDNATYGAFMDANREWTRRNERTREAAWRREQKRKEAAAAREAEWLAYYKSKQAEWDARDVAARELGIA